MLTGRRWPPINTGKNFITDVDDQVLKKLVSAKKLKATRRLPGTSKNFPRCGADLVPTPFTATKDPDISYMVSATKDIARSFHRDMLVVLISTTSPTTTKVVKPILGEDGLKAGKDLPGLLAGTDEPFPATRNSASPTPPPWWAV